MASSSRKGRPARHPNYGQLEIDPSIYLESDPPGFITKPVDYISENLGRAIGLFADRDFKSGEFLLNYRGERNNDAPINPYVYEYECTSTSTSGRQMSCIDARNPESGLGRFINDKDPHHHANCKPIVTPLDNGTSSTISFVALTHINKGNFLNFCDVSIQMF